MVLTLVAIAFVLAIAFYQSLFGLFSGLINLVCTVLAVALAYGCSEPLYGLLAKQLPAASGYAEGACLVGVFVIALFALRTGADMFIRGNVRLPQWVDWVGGGLCGFVNAELTVGVLLCGVLLLPLGGQVMTFARMERLPADEASGERYAQFKTNEITLFKPDAFAAGFFSMLSSGSLSGGTPFRSVYPDYPEWVFWTGNTTQDEANPAPYRDDRVGDGFTQGVKVITWWTEKGGLEVLYRKDAPTYQAFRETKLGFGAPFTYTPEPGKRLLGVRVQLARSSGDRKGTSAMHMFRPTMLRVVGDIGPGASAKPAQYYARIVGGLEMDTAKTGGRYRLVDIDNNLAPPGEAPTIDVLFEVAEGFEPSFVEYKRHARAALTPGQLWNEAKERTPRPASLGSGAPVAATPPAGAATNTPDAGATGQPPQPPPQVSGRFSFMDAVVMEHTGVKAELPVPLKAEAARDEVRTEDNKLQWGQIYGFVDDLKGSGRQSISLASVPEGQKLFRLAFKAYKAHTLPGQVFDFVSRTVNTYEAWDTEGGRYPLVGYYAIVKREGKDYIELFYAGDPVVPESAAYSHMLDFKKIEMRELTDEASDAEVGLFFVVPPGKTIDKVVNQKGDGAKGLNQKT
jgi:hypothetical protein